MKVKKYIANSMPEAMKEIRKELGKEAVILQSKEIKQKGLFGRFRKKKIEVIAAKDPEPIKEAKPRPSLEPRSKGKQNQVTLAENGSEAKILQEIQSLKKILELESEKSGAKFPVDYQLALQHLIDREVDQKMAEELVAETKNLLEEKETEVTPEAIRETLRRKIADRLGGLSFQGIVGDEKIVQFVGPTGVGKTTTIAKVAAQLILKEKKKVAFITTDTYRIAAVEQLKTYARILNVPLEVAYNIDDYKQAIDKLSAYDVILVDTAGRNYRNPVYIEQLKEMMVDVPGIVTYLVLALTAKPDDLQDLFLQFEKIPLKEVIFTKADETKAFGSILSISLKNDIGIAYITNGQDVPDDLVKPEPALLSGWIVGEET